MTRMARTERTALCDLALQLGEDQPTLSGEWTVKDLVVHLLVRERSPAAVGIAVPPLARFTELEYRRVDKYSYQELIALFKSGPPALSAFAIPGADEAANTVEYFVHHEDVRRAQPDWEPRPYDEHREKALWKLLPFTARMTYKSSPVGVTLVRPDGEHIVAKPGANGVVITGEVSELVMLAFGRDQARVEYSGDADAVERVRSLNRSV